MRMLKMCAESVVASFPCGVAMMTQGLELKVPPVAVVLSAAGLIYACARTVPSLGVAYPGRLVVAAGLGLAGAVVCLLGVVAFRRAKTTVNPLKPASASSLVVDGIYRLTRNPMYLGFLLILLGWAAFVANALAPAPIALFVVYLDRFQIRPEERALDERFGAAFADYKNRVRRWI